MTRLVWLFDIDGTLIRTYGAAREAFSEAAEAVLGVRDSMEDLPLAGGLDPLILGSILAKHERVLSPDQTERFWEIARRRMGDILQSGRGHVLPGVGELLAGIAREPGWTSALLTGNTAAMARLKLGHFRLLDHFAFGAFGDEAPDRDALACVAVERARERCGVGADRCVVVGDTHRDVRCARAAGAWSVSVATGVQGPEELALHGPDLLLDDLSDTESLLEWARRLDLRELGSGRTSAPRP